MSNGTRIYLVDDKRTLRLVRAPNAAQAIRHCAHTFTAAVVSQDTLEVLLGLGTKVEEIERGDD